MTLHIFNPDTDYALAANRRYYTPPAHVVAVRRKFALLPARYAEEGDVILLLDKPEDDLQRLPYFGEAQNKGIQIITADELAEFRLNAYDLKISPWGWNKSLKQFLVDVFGQSDILPTDDEIESIRELSHRRTTIDFHLAMSALTSDEIKLPQEIFSVDEAMAAYNSSKNRYFKAPWSSSGRGILLTDDLEPRHVEPWLRGIITRQGSVMMEKAYKRILDFATEWIIYDGRAEFLGYSVFNTSRRGKYHSNVEASQQELLQIIKSKTGKWNDGWIDQLKNTIEAVVGGKYNGPLGIDMLVTDSGNINPCVELNFRRTMGMINIPTS